MIKIAIVLCALLLPLAACSDDVKTEPVALGENAATLSITSVPLGAAVVLDGKAIGPTPQTIQVRSGQHNLVVRKSGYFAVTEKLFLGPRRTVQKHVTLVASH